MSDHKVDQHQGVPFLAEYSDLCRCGHQRLAHKSERLGHSGPRECAAGACDCEQFVFERRATTGERVQESFKPGFTWKPDEKKHDPVEHPSHYTQGKVECIDAIEAAVQNLTGIEAFLTGQVLKYAWRWKGKNGLEDLKKCQWYLDRLVKHAGPVKFVELPSVLTTNLKHAAKLGEEVLSAAVREVLSRQSGGPVAPKAIATCAKCKREHWASDLNNEGWCTSCVADFKHVAALMAPYAFKVEEKAPKTETTEFRRTEFQPKMVSTPPAIICVKCKRTVAQVNGEGWCQDCFDAPKNFVSATPAIAGTTYPCRRCGEYVDVLNSEKWCRSCFAEPKMETCDVAKPESSRHAGGSKGTYCDMKKGHKGPHHGVDSNFGLRMWSST